MFLGFTGGHNKEWGKSHPTSAMIPKALLPLPKRGQEAGTKHTMVTSLCSAERSKSFSCYRCDVYMAAMNLSVVSWVFEATNERQDFLFLC